MNFFSLKNISFRFNLAFILFLFVLLNTLMFIRHYEKGVVQSQVENELLAKDITIALIGYLNNYNYDSATYLLDQVFQSKENILSIKLSSNKSEDALIYRSRRVQINPSETINFSKAIRYGYDGVAILEFSSKKLSFWDVIRSLGLFFASTFLITVVFIQFLSYKNKHEVFKAQENQKIREYLQDLESKNQELEARNQKLDEFSYVIAHSLSNSLRIIDNYSFFLKEDYVSDLDDDAVVLINKIISSSSQISHLINSLVSSIYLETNEMEVSKVNIGVILNEVLMKLKSTDYFVSVDVKLNGPFYEAECDSRLIFEVFYQLILNAAIFNLNKNKKIEISQINTVNGPVYAIKDNGIGIDPSFQDKIFSMFMRLNSGEDFAQGVGMGLSIVSKIINQHQGWIKIHSELNQGTIVYFQLYSKNDGFEIIRL